MYVSVTGLRLRRPWHAPVFWWHAIPSMTQARRAEGNLLAQTRMVDGVRHTLTVWRDVAAMRVYLASGAYAKAMAAFHGIATGTVHGYESDTLPDWETALDLWRRHGRQAGARPSPTSGA
jgi:hypothetical protein